MKQRLLNVHFDAVHFRTQAWWMGQQVPLEVPVYPVTRRHGPMKRNLLFCARIDKTNQNCGYDTT